MQTTKSQDSVFNTFEKFCKEGYGKAIRGKQDELPKPVDFQRFFVVSEDIQKPMFLLQSIEHCNVIDLTRKVTDFKTRLGITDWSEITTLRYLLTEGKKSLWLHGQILISGSTDITRFHSTRLDPDDKKDSAYILTYSDCIELIKQAFPKITTSTNHQFQFTFPSNEYFSKPEGFVSLGRPVEVPKF